MGNKARSITSFDNYKVFVEGSRSMSTGAHAAALEVARGAISVMKAPDSGASIKYGNLNGRVDATLEVLKQHSGGACGTYPNAAAKIIFQLLMDLDAVEQSYEHVKQQRDDGRETIIVDLKRNRETEWRNKQTIENLRTRVGEITEARELWEESAALETLMEAIKNAQSDADGSE